MIRVSIAAFLNDEDFILSQMKYNRILKAHHEVSPKIETSTADTAKGGQRFGLSA